MLFVVCVCVCVCAYSDTVDLVFHGWTTTLLNDQKGDVVECEIDEIGTIRNVIH